MPTQDVRLGIRLLLWSAVAVAAAWMVGQIWRDACWLTGLCFYIPSPLLVVVLVLTALVAWRSARLWALASLFLACGPLALVMLVENHWTSPPALPSNGFSRRLVHWNVFYGKLGWAGICARLQDSAADAYVLSEVPNDLDLADTAAALGNNFASLRFGDLAMMAKGSLTERQQRTEGEGKAYLVEWQFANDRWSVLIVDLPSSIWIARRPLLEWVVGLMVELQPDLIVGDFNAPRRSAALSALPAGYRHAYDLVGTGWSSTWPVPVPCWAIDECIVSDRLEPLDYELRSTSRSDHRLQLLDFQRRPTAIAAR